MKMGRNQFEVSEKNYEEGIVLELRKELVLTPVQSFNFRYSLWKPSHFYTGLEMHTLTHSYRTFRLDVNTYTVIEAYKNNNKINIKIYANKDLYPNETEEIYKRVAYSYGIFEEYNLPKKYFDRNDYMKKVIKVFYGTRISCPESLFEISVISLLLQNTTILRTVQMFKNLIEQYGKVVKFNDIVLFSFFTPENLSDVEESILKATCRLGYRTKYIINYANFFVCNKNRDLLRLDKQNLLEKLQTIKGVGPYTSNVIASHALRDTRAIPLDSWNRGILSNRIYNRNVIDKEDLQKMLHDDFGDYAGLVALYVIESEYINQPIVPLYCQRKQLNIVDA
jgi:3-methyladenine DNA glycosylase/8-oxoguanine DNA glycosylase